MISRNKNTYLMHYGVKGMKWGVRKDEDQKAAAYRIKKTIESNSNSKDWAGDWYADLSGDKDIQIVREYLYPFAREEAKSQMRYNMLKSEGNSISSAYTKSGVRDSGDNYFKATKEAVNELLGNYGDVKVTLIDKKDVRTQSVKDFVDEWITEEIFLEEAVGLFGRYADKQAEARRKQRFDELAEEVRLEDKQRKQSRG